MATVLHGSSTLEDERAQTTLHEMGNGDKTDRPRMDDGNRMILMGHAVRFSILPEYSNYQSKKTGLQDAPARAMVAGGQVPSAQHSSAR